MSQRASILRRQRRIQEKDGEKKELFPHASLQKNQVKVKDCKNSPIIQSSLECNRIMIHLSPVETSLQAPHSSFAFPKDDQLLQ